MSDSSGEPFAWLLTFCLFGGLLGLLRRNGLGGGGRHNARSVGLQLGVAHAILGELQLRFRGVELGARGFERRIELPGGGSVTGAGSVDGGTATGAGGASGGAGRSVPGISVWTIFRGLAAGLLEADWGGGGLGALGLGGGGGGASSARVDTAGFGAGGALAGAALGSTAGPVGKSPQQQIIDSAEQVIADALPKVADAAKQAEALIQGLALMFGNLHQAALAVAASKEVKN